MADLITLQGTAQQTGKKVVGYKFPNNLDELKFPIKLLFHPNYSVGLKEKITTDKGTTYKNISTAKEVVIVKRDGKNLLTKEGYVLSSFDKNSVVISPEKINSDTIPNIPVSVPKAPTSSTSTPTSTSTSNSTLEQDLNNSPLGKTARKIQIGFSVVGWGVFGILAYKFWNKSMTWKVMISVFGAYNLYSTYKIFSKPALKVSGGSDSNINIGTTGTTTPKGMTGTTNNLTKSQKIDLIIKNQSGSEPVDADEVNNSKAFLNTLNDAELTIWINLSKALKDTEISQAGESGDMRQLYGLLKSKYGLNQKEVEEQMKKMGEFLMGGVEQALQEGFTNQNQSAFSNFESSLNLDL
jgi:hypothetical protein